MARRPVDLLTDQWLIPRSTETTRLWLIVANTGRVVTATWRLLSFPHDEDIQYQTATVKRTACWFAALSEFHCNSLTERRVYRLMAIISHSFDAIAYSNSKSENNGQRCLLSGRSVGGSTVCTWQQTQAAAAWTWKSLFYHAECLKTESARPSCFKPQWLHFHYVAVSLREPRLPSWLLANRRASALPEGWSQRPDYP